LHHSVIALVLVQAACASSPSAEPAAEPANEGSTNCVIIEVQNTSLFGASVWVVWENSPARRLGRLSLSERRVFVLPFRNTPLRLRFEPEGGSQVVYVTNEELPTPGVRFTVIYRINGPGPLLRVGNTRCP